MQKLIEHTQLFAEIADRTISEMFGTDPANISTVLESDAVDTSKQFIVSLYYTGTVYGEYMLAMDEKTAARILELDVDSIEDSHEEFCEEIGDAFSEALNTIVGEAIVDLQESYAKLTLTAPRVYFGKIRYPQFRTGRSILQTDAGEVECFFCLDLMRLDLATSYQDAMDSLLTVNSQLKEANQHLAEQQAQLVHAEKMASVGVLASGVAHEINTPLFFVDTNMAALIDYIGVIDSILTLYENLSESVTATGLDRLKEFQEVRDATEEEDLCFVMEDTKRLAGETREGVERIKHIVQSLRDFSQIDAGGYSQANINVIVENTCRLINQKLEHCEVTRKLDSVPEVLCNAGEIGQVLAAVMLNAGAAVSDTDGEIDVSTAVMDESVTLTVRDNGVGIAQEDLNHIFEPFFTTRTVNEGTGLGLSIAYGIMEKHQGSIGVESELGSGTKVTLTLPLQPTQTATPEPASLS